MDYNLLTTIEPYKTPNHPHVLPPIDEVRTNSSVHAASSLAPRSDALPLGFQTGFRGSAGWIQAAMGVLK